MEKFRVVVTGCLIPGFEAPTVQKQLANLLGKDEVFAGRIMAAGIKTVKSGVDSATAVHYVRELRAIGIDCKFEPDTLDFDTNTDAVAAASIAASTPATNAARSQPTPIRSHISDTPRASPGELLFRGVAWIVYGLGFILVCLIGLFLVTGGDKKSSPPASDLTQIVVPQQPTTSASTAPKPISNVTRELESVQTYFVKLYALGDTINTSYERCQAASRQSLARLDLQETRRAFATHGATMRDVMKALNGVVPPTVNDKTTRAYLQLAKEGLIEDASAQEKQAAVMTKPPSREEDVAEAARYTEMSNMGTAKFVLNVMRTYDRYGYDMDDVDIDKHTLKRGAQPRAVAGIKK